jgi:trigger factor
MIKKMYGTTVLVDEINKIVSDSLTDYIKNEKLDILGDPIPKHDSHTFDPTSRMSSVSPSSLGWRPEFEVNLNKKQKLTRYLIDLTQR